jgi:hypothetical protein
MQVLAGMPRRPDHARGDHDDIGLVRSQRGQAGVGIRGVKSCQDGVGSLSCRQLSQPGGSAAGRRFRFSLKLAA